MSLQRIESLPSLPPRPADSNKGQFGHVLVVAGSRGLAGAAALCGASALRSGAGLVRIASPAEVQPVVASFEPSYMTYPLPQDEDGLIDFEAARPRLERLAAAATVVAAGPGLGQSDGILAVVRWLLESSGKPLVLDADALNVLSAGHLDLLGRRDQPVVITPHPGEMARLVGDTAKDVQAARVDQAAKLAGRFEALTVVLKGTGTVVTDGRRVYVNTTGNPGMATGGTGDCLTGVVAAMIGQGLPPFEGAQLGVYIHGLAGDIAKDQNGVIGLIAGDIVDALPDAFEHASRDPDIGF
ncbi:Bifunctional NAD(P)H-hydrate repair enzyme Nnr [Aquisphaera giovannonii]|uniref:ADP-dependent (S)-NAD(P)H-hydrate dehydratase n=1 Tax=Aquisphaera giovannonii TaxID=406548 RepID=A0A5B9WBL7_9BACT|nr:NAD(P)H-hydrate dehydratase [Aquisphaera giovannonii]QEH37411.1 Bifunctional NAD(P)H-hydrate repair enzyme Nnr [Aquisphaera giovannonii]